jgi:hypothetical protein
VKALLLVVFVAANGFFVPCALADRAGNGGDAKVCYDTENAIVSVEMLDIYEGREMFQPPVLPVLESLGQNEYEIAAAAVDRLPDFDRSRKAKLKEWIANFERESVRLNGITLVDLDDSQHILVPDGCKIEQIAWQNEPQFSRDPRYKIDNDLYSKMSGPADRAALVLHEVIYREAVSLHHSDSRAARAMTAMVASGDLAGMDYESYRALVQTELKFPLGSDCVHEVCFIENSVVRTDRGVRGRLLEDTKIYLGRQPLLVCDDPSCWTTEPKVVFFAAQDLVELGHRGEFLTAMVHTDANVDDCGDMPSESTVWFERRPTQIGGVHADWFTCKYRVGP